MRKFSSVLLCATVMWLAQLQTKAQSTSDMPTDTSTVSSTVSSSLCQPGYYMYMYNNGMNGYCNGCPSGAYCPGNTYAPIPCPLGTSTNYMWSASECTTCPQGTYASVPGSEQCQSCPPGYYCPDPAKGPIECPLGTSSNWMSNSVECWPCQDGMIANTTGMKQCNPCPEGFYCPNATTAIPCPRGMASRASVSPYIYEPRDYTKCVACPVGTFTNGTGTPTCQQCPDGFFCPDPVSSPVQCPKGTSSMVDYPDNAYYYNANKNYYYVSYDSYYRRIYANGQTYLVGERCYPCPISYYADVAGLRLCKKCPDGNMCPDKTQPPTPCPVGFFSSANMYYQYYQNGYGWLNPSIIGDTCMRCQPGTYTNTSGSTFCTQCNSGMFCPDPALKPTSAPLGFIVSYNQYWDGNEYLYQINIWRCSKGTYTRTGPDMWYPYYYGSNTCESCPYGYVCPDPSLPPQTCPPGLYSNSWQASVCYPCSPGTYEKNNNCESCPPGYSCPYATQQPIPCPRGSYSFIGQNTCTKCPANSYNTGIGSTGCLPCPDGCCCSDPSRDPVCPA